MNSDLKKYIGLEVKAARKRQGLTQEQLAERLEKAVETVSNIERGKTWTSLEMLNTLADTLDRPIQSFFPPDSRTRRRSEKLMKLDVEIAQITEKMSVNELEQLVRVARAMKS